MLMHVDFTASYNSLPNLHRAGKLKIELQWLIKGVLKVINTANFY